MKRDRMREYTKQESCEGRIAVVTTKAILCVILFIRFSMRAHVRNEAGIDEARKAIISGSNFAIILSLSLVLRQSKHTKSIQEYYKRDPCRWQLTD